MKSQHAGDATPAPRSDNASMKLALALVIAVHAIASAEPRTDPPPRAALVIIDSVDVSLVAGGYALVRLTLDQRGCDVCAADFGLLMMVLGASGYVAMSPIYHHAHDHDGRAVLGTVVRVGLPLAGALTSYELARAEAPVIAATGTGIVAALVFDWFVLAHEPAVYGAPIAHGAVVGIGGRW